MSLKKKKKKLLIARVLWEKSKFVKLTTEHGSRPRLYGFFCREKKLPSNLRRDKNEKLPCQE